MRLQDRKIARIAFFANRPLTAKVYTRMSAAGPQLVTAVFAQYGDMHSAPRQSQTLIDLAPIAELGAKAAKSCYHPYGPRIQRFDRLTQQLRSLRVQGIRDENSFCS